MRGYNPLWPEVVVWWGAGASVGLNLLTTDNLAYQITQLSKVNEKLYKENKEQEIENRVKIALEGKGNENPLIVDYLKELILLLESEDKEENTQHIKENYDWETLKKIIKITPTSGETVLIQDIFNLMDMYIFNRTGFVNYTTGEFIDINKISAARDSLKLITIFLQTIQYIRLIESNPKKIEPYYKFALAIGRLMQEEGLLLKDEVELTKREFLLESISFICLNWDPILLWLLFCANKELNENSNIDIGKYSEKLKLYHDLGYFMGVRKVDGDTPEVWYPFNESIVNRINTEKYATGKKVRIGKFHFPHGCLGWRECPNCGKLTCYLGSSKEWEHTSKNLFPPSISYEFGLEARLNDEKKEQNNKRYDHIQCSFCGTMTETKNTPIVMQTNYKLNNPPFIEEIQRDMKVGISKARHMVFMGYSLPPDDIIYKSIIATKISNEELIITLVVGCNKDAEDKYYTEDEAKEYWNELKNKNQYATDKEIGKETYNSIKSILDGIAKDVTIRMYFKGIPSVFEASTDQEVFNKVKGLFYPNGTFEKYISERKKKYENLSTEIKSNFY